MIAQFMALKIELSLGAEDQKMKLMRAVAAV